MDQVIIQNVRCFHDRKAVPLRPITLLLGENSTGKSTFLALTRIAWHIFRGSTPPNFNDDPFHLGSYDQIASIPRNQGTPPEFFIIGGQVSASSLSFSSPTLSFRASIK